MRLGLRKDDGATAVIVALLTVILVGMAAFVADVGVAYANKRQLSTAADAASLAAAQTLASRDGTCAQIVSAGGADAESTATGYIEGQEATLRDATVVPGSFSIVCSTDGTYADVTLDVVAPTPSLFAGVFGRSIDQVSRSSTARFGTIGNPGGLRPYAVCAADALQLRANARDNDPSNDLLIVQLEGNNGNNGGGNNAGLPRTAPAIQTTTTLTVTPSSGLTTTTTVALSATVVEKGSGAPVTQGAVTFTFAGTQIGVGNLNGSGVATFSGTLPAGSGRIVAEFAGTQTHRTSDDRTGNITVTLATTPPPTTAPPTTAPPTTAPPTTEPPLQNGPCGTEPGNFGQLNFADFPTTDRCEEDENGNNNIFACYIENGYDEPFTLPTNIAADTGADCDSKCEDAWETLRERQITLPVFTTVTGSGNNVDYTVPYVVGVKVCGYWFGSNTNWFSPTCGQDWSTVTPAPKNIDTYFQFRFTDLVISGTIGGTGCQLGQDCDIARGVALAPGPNGRS